MIYKIELPEKITEYMQKFSGTIENYVQTRIIDPILRELEKAEFNLTYAPKLEQINIELKELKKEVSIKEELQETENFEVTTGEQQVTIVESETI